VCTDVTSSTTLSFTVSKRDGYSCKLACMLPSRQPYCQPHRLQQQAAVVARFPAEYYFHMSQHTQSSFCHNQQKYYTEFHKKEYVLKGYLPMKLKSKEKST